MLTITRPVNRGFKTLGRVPVSQRKIVGVLVDGSVLSSREIGQLTGVSKNALWEALRRCWVDGLVLRSDKPFYEQGRGGRPWNVRPYHLYALKPAGVGEEKRLRENFGLIGYYFLA